jgi:hypothetical protein
MKRYRITRRADGAVICWVQPSTGDRYALPFAPVSSRCVVPMDERPAYASLPGTGPNHLAKALLADHLGPEKTFLRRFPLPYLQAFRTPFLVEQDPLGTTITSLEIDAWRLSWQAQQPKPRRRRSSG